MNNKQLRMTLLGAIGLAAVAFIAVCVLGLSMLSKQSQKMVSLKLKSSVLNYQLSSLAGAKKQVQQYSYINNVADEVIPNDKDQAQAVLEIFQIANQAGIAIQSISFPTSTLSAATANSSTLISQAKPVVGIKGLYSVQLTITPETGTQVPDDLQVSYPKMLDFLNRIELNQRTAQITQVNIQPQGSSSGNDTAPGSITFSLTVNIFIKP